MTWMQYSPGFRRQPIARGSAEALVVVLHDLGDSAATLSPIAARWATTVPGTAFTALEGIERPALPCNGLAALKALDADAGLTALDRAARHLRPLLEQQLRSCRLDASRLVLVGFGYGGTLALHLLLSQAWRCAGVLAFAAKLTRPLPRILRVGGKVRLIECAGNGHIGHSGFGDIVAALAARGIDARGALVAGSPLSAEAIRHGGAYLVELVATAQRGDRFQLGQERHGALVPTVLE